MLHLIDSVDDPRVELYRDIRGTPLRHKQAGLFLAEARTCVFKLLTSDINIHSILAARRFYDRPAVQDLLTRRRVNTAYCASPALMNELVGFKLHQPILAIGQRPPRRELADIKLPAVALDAMINAENVGAIVRSCAAFGVKSLLVDGKSASPYLRRAVRTSMGAIFNMPLFEVDQLDLALQTLKQTKNARIVAAEQQPTRSLSLREVKFTEKDIVVIGSENNGVNDTVLTLADEIAEIPMNAVVDSLNAAAAAAVILYAADFNRF